MNAATLVIKNSKTHRNNKFGENDDRIDSMNDFFSNSSSLDGIYKDFVFLALSICQAPMAMISMAERHHHRILCQINIPAEKIERSHSFCNESLNASGQLFEVPDALIDPRFSSSAFLIERCNVRFYAGISLVDEQGQALGTISVMDTVPRHLDSSQRFAFEALARRLTGQMQTAFQLGVTSQQSLTDALTGVSNRRCFDSKMTQEWNYHLHERKEMALIVFDVDKFKSFNDEFGHKLGDSILIQVAAAVTAVLRRGDFFARYGGEEFAIILSNRDSKGASVVAEKIRKTIEFFPWSFRAITVSVGICVVIPSEKISIGKMISLADEAMYKAKKLGRNRVYI